MPERSSIATNRTTGFNPAAEDLEKVGKDPLAVELGRRGGKKGGVARAAKLTPEQRQATAKKAAQARWTRVRSLDGDNDSG